MPKYMVYGPRDADVAKIITTHCPKAIIVAVDISESATVVAKPDINVTESLGTHGLHIVRLEEYINDVLWTPMKVRPVVGIPLSRQTEVAQILGKRFSARATEDPSVFKIPIPCLDLGSIAQLERQRIEYEFRMRTIRAVEEVMTVAGIPVEIGLVRW